MIGCTCTGDGKETYPTKESLKCNTPDTPTLTNPKYLTWNIDHQSREGEWNKFMPWRKPGSAKPIDSCGIASGFLPSAAVQYPHAFKDQTIKQGMKGTELKKGEISYWKPGATVEIKLRFSVNHGGGYQYRVCPTDKNNNINEACFEKNVLRFATKKHLVETNNKKISIAAVDVTEGVVPAGSSWRRIPFPACNCDLGSSCAVYNASVSGNKDKSNDTMSYTNGTPYGSCKTGLQFEAPHLKDGSWPDGYGYYVEFLQDNSKNNVNKKTTSGKKSGCYANFKSKSTCDSQSGCIWKNEKGGYCIEKEGCSVYTEKGNCNNANGCAWYTSKSQCYKPETSGGKNTPKGKKVHSWELVDEVIAPVKDGAYILQWRWDNEQTPQIWTSCADIYVCDGCAPSKLQASFAASLFYGNRSIGGVYIWTLLALVMGTIGW